MSNDQPTSELNSVIDDMMLRITKVADLVDLAFPDKAAGESLKHSVDKLKNYVVELEQKVQATSEPVQMVLDNSIYSELKTLAIKECIKTFKKLEDLNYDDIAKIQILGTHARDLFSTIMKFEFKGELGND